MSWRKLILSSLALAVIVVGVSLNVTSTSTAISSANASEKVCEFHGIAVDSCTRCNPELIPAFKAKGDWCNEHKLPESQCDICNPSLKKVSESKSASAQVSVQAEKEQGSTVAVDWCAEHGVPESQCTKCNPKLIDAFKAKGDWCGGHDLPESHCYQCNPGLKFAQEEQAKQPQAKPESAAIDWCAEHRVPESECTKCHPSLVEAFKAKGDWCGGHDIPESHCYLCNPGIKFEQEAEYKKQQAGQKQSHVPNTSLHRANAAQCATDKAVIQFASIQTAARSGLSIVSVDESPSSETLDVPGEVEFDATHSMSVTCPVSGVLMRWVVNPGDQVQRGQIIAYIESIDAAERMADFIHASALHKLASKALYRKQDLAQQGLASVRELDEAEADLMQAQADVNRASSVLIMLGYSDENLAELVSDTDNSRLVPLRARQSGKLVEQAVKLGAILEAGQPIGMISETAQLWVEAQVPESGMDRVQVGQTATVSFDGNGWTSGAGNVIWVADGVDETTRMGKVRIAIEPNGTNLRAHQFVRVNIETSPADNTVLIPIDAVQWEGCCNVVFIQETPDRFRPRKVTVDYTAGDFYAVRGIERGEMIVGKGSYMLKTELMKSSIGAGCCGEGA